ncbi:MAG: carbon storage regulator [bacterium]|nr:carbon storage regulator [bacterium]
MLRLTVSTEEYLMIGEDVRIIFLGGTGKHMRVMIDAPKDVNVVRSSVIEKKFTDPELKAKLPRYYPEPERPEKYKKKRVVIAGNPEKKEQETAPQAKAAED